MRIPEEKRIKDYGLLLAEKYPEAILNWVIQGALSWRRHGLKEPATVTAAVQSYRRQQDVLFEYLNTNAYTDDPTVIIRVKIY